MRVKSRILAFLMAAAMVVTSVPVNGTITAKAAESEQTVTISDTAVTWDASKFTDENITVRGNIITNVTEFNTGRQYVGTMTVPTVRENILVNDTAIRSIFGVETTGTAVAATDLTISYQWYKIDNKGVAKEMSRNSNSYSVYAYRENGEADFTYRCVATVSKAIIDGTTYTLDSKAETVAAVTYDFVYKYTGITEEDIAAGNFNSDDYYALDRWNEKDEEVVFYGKSEKIYLPDCYIELEDTRVAWILTANYKDGSSEELDNDSTSSWFSETDVTKVSYTDSTGEKEVQSFDIELQIKYGSFVLYESSKHYNVVFKGISKEDVDENPDVLQEFYKGLKGLENRELYYYDNSSAASATVTPGVSSKMTSLATVNYTWKAYAYDDSELEVESVTAATSIPEKELPLYQTFGTESKQVKRYTLDISYIYEGEEVGTASVEYTTVLNPIRITSESGKFKARQGERIHLSVTAENATSYDIGEITYQWYKVAANGTATVIKGETLNETYVKIEDYNVSYQCVVTATNISEIFPDAQFAESVTVNFVPTNSSGFRVVGKSETTLNTHVGGTAQMWIEAVVDKGYTLSYQWQKATNKTDSDGNYIFEDIAKATSSSYTIQSAEEEDFNYVSVGEGGYWRTHRVEISAQKGGEVVETFYTYYRLYKDADYEYFTNSGTKTAVVGKDTELYCETEILNKNVTLEKKWYKEVARMNMFRATNEDGSYKEDENGYYIYDVPEDPSVTLPTENEYDYVDTSAVSFKAVEGTNRYYKTFYYYKEINKDAKDTSYCVLAGVDKKGNAINHDGFYRCRVIKTTKGSDAKSENYWSYTVKTKSNLAAYAKNETVTASVGESAQLEVMAQNAYEKGCPISYQWQKYDAQAGDYVDINGANSATYSIKKVTADDFLQYRVKVSDEYTAAINVDISLTNDGVEEIFYTPENNYYNCDIGESAVMEVKAKLSEGAQPIYTWYSTEEYYSDYSNTVLEEVDWQILGATTSKYTKKVISQEDYTTYKCVMTYKKNGAYVEKTFYFHVRNNAFITLERTSAYEQYKKVGDGVSFGFRVAKTSEEVDTENVRYQWYSYNNGIIEGATDSTYSIAKLTADDFGQYYCRVYYNNANDYKTIYYYVMLYSNVTLVNSRQTVKVKKGDSVTLETQVENPSNATITYQWQVYGKYGNNYNGNDIYGENGSTFTINNIGTNDFGTYYCDIYVDGIYVDYYRYYVEEDTSETLTVDYAEGYESDVTVSIGKNTTFKVNAVSSKGLKLYYQWYFNNKALGGATTNTYTVTAANANDEGDYYCLVTDEKGATAGNSILFDLYVKDGIVVDNGWLYSNDTMGYDVKVGQKVVLKANVSTDNTEEIFYQWYKGDVKLYGETKSTLTINKVTTEDLGGYRCYCEMRDAGGNTLDYEYQYYYLYINTGLVTEPGTRYPIANADGSLTMFMEARADAGYKIYYQWQKYDDESRTYVDIEGAVGSSYRISKLKKEDYGTYRCTVATMDKRDGYMYEYGQYLYYVSKEYQTELSREFAVEGDSFKLMTTLYNAASDSKYTYEWYQADAETGEYKKLPCSSATYSGIAPQVRMNGSRSGYDTVKYICCIMEDDVVYASCNFSLCVLPSLVYSTTLPETTHPFVKEVDTKAYRIPGASSLKITLDSRSNYVYVIDKAGNSTMMGGEDGEFAITIEGDTAIFLAYKYDDYGVEYGYKVTSIVDPNPKKPTIGTTIGSGNNNSGSATVAKKKVPAKNTTHTVGKLVYKVTKSSATKGTVTVLKAKSKKAKAVTIPATVKLNGYKFKVTQISAKAFNGCKKLQKVTIGKNVTKIGKQAFNECKKVTTITIKATKLKVKKVDKTAFKGIASKATILVPKKNVKAYKKFLKKCGVPKKAKIKKA